MRTASCRLLPRAALTVAMPILLATAFLSSAFAETARAFPDLLRQAEAASPAWLRSRPRSLAPRNWPSKPELFRIRPLVSFRKTSPARVPSPASTGWKPPFRSTSRWNWAGSGEPVNWRDRPRSMRHAYVMPRRKRLWRSTSLRPMWKLKRQA